jgi:hypothetical protein
MKADVSRLEMKKEKMTGKHVLTIQEQIDEKKKDKTVTWNKRSRSRIESR